MKVIRNLNITFELTENEARDVYLILKQNHTYPSCSLKLCSEIVKALGYTPQEVPDI